MPKKIAKGWTILTVGSVPTILVLGNSMLIPVLPQMKAETGVTSFQTSLVITLFSVSAALFIPISGYLSDRFTRKAVIVPSLIAYGLGGLLAGFAAAWFSAPYFWILAGRILQGIGAAGTSPVAMALAGDLFKDGEQSKVLGLMEAANGFGKVISPILGSLFALFVWYASFFAFPIFCLVSLLLFLVFVKERKRGKNAPSFGRYAKGLLSSFKTEGRWLFAAFLAGSVCLFTLFGILFYISEVLEKDYQIEGIRKGLILAIPLLFMTSTSYITGSKIGKKRTRMKASIVFGLFLMAASFTALIFFQRLVPFFSVLAVSSIGTGLVLPCINSLITGSVPSARRGIVTALYGSVRFLGAAFGPPVYSSLMEWSRSGMFLVTGGLSLFAALLSLLLIHGKSRSRSGREKATLFEKWQLS